MKKKSCWSSILFCLVISDSKQLQKLFKSAIFIFNCKINKILRYKAHWVTKHIEVICNIIYSTLLLQILIVLCYGNMYVKTIAATFFNERLLYLLLQDEALCQVWFWNTKYVKKLYPIHIQAAECLGSATNTTTVGNQGYTF